MEARVILYKIPFAITSAQACKNRDEHLSVSLPFSLRFRRGRRAPVEWRACGERRPAKIRVQRITRASNSGTAPSVPAGSTSRANTSKPGVAVGSFWNKVNSSGSRTLSLLAPQYHAASSLSTPASPSRAPRISSISPAPSSSLPPVKTPCTSSPNRSAKRRSGSIRSVAR